MKNLEPKKTKYFAVIRNNLKKDEDKKICFYQIQSVEKKRSKSFAVMRKNLKVKKATEPDNLSDSHPTGKPKMMDHGLCFPFFVIADY